jgi:DNA processing protein
VLYWIWLTQIKGVGNKRQRLLLGKFGSPKNVYMATLAELSECNGIGKNIAVKITEQKSLAEAKAKAILEKVNKLDISLLTLNDPLYPHKAKIIEEMPILLYYKGKIIKNSMGVAIVGARRGSNYGKMVTDEAASYLAKEKISVISGMAKGIDGYAHTSCLKSAGYTVAVLGNGLDICYPPEHINLMEQIIKNGAIISQYPPGVKPHPKHFPKRNLLIAAWSYKVLVVEAGTKSGSLITANYGKRYGREVFAVPGSIYRAENMGCNKLIYDGAKIYINKEQLLIENRYESEQKAMCDFNNNSFNSFNSLDEAETLIIEILTKYESKTLEELSELLNIDKMQLLGKLSLMELEDKVVVQGSKVSRGQSR